MLESPLVADPHKHFCSVLKLKLRDLQLLTAAETGQVCLSVNAGRARSARKYHPVYSSHIDYTSSFMLTAQLLSVNHSAYRHSESFYFIPVCISLHLLKSKLALQVFNRQQDTLSGRQRNWHFRVDKLHAAKLLYTSHLGVFAQNSLSIINIKTREVVCDVLFMRCVCGVLYVYSNFSHHFTFSCRTPPPRFLPHTKVENCFCVCFQKEKKPDPDHERKWI